MRMGLSQNFSPTNSIVALVLSGRKKFRNFARRTRRPLTIHLSVTCGLCTIRTGLRALRFCIGRHITHTAGGYWADRPTFWHIGMLIISRLIWLQTFMLPRMGETVWWERFRYMTL